MKTIADLDDFEKLSLEKLTSIHGLGIAKASQILSAIKTIITKNQKAVLKSCLISLDSEY